jgi:hypothetical protein
MSYKSICFCCEALRERMGTFSKAHARLLWLASACCLFVRTATFSKGHAPLRPSAD